MTGTAHVTFKRPKAYSKEMRIRPISHLQMRRLFLHLVWASSIAGISNASAHRGEDHSKPAQTAPQLPQDHRKAVFEQISSRYSSDIYPIFERSCMDCHGAPRALPWYAALPGAKQLITSDIREAKEHLEFGSAFPFKSHGTPQEDLKSIGEAVEDGTMPPWRYWIMHWRARLSTEEKAKIAAWANDAIKTLDRSTD